MQVPDAVNDETQLTLRVDGDVLHAPYGILIAIVTRRPRCARTRGGGAMARCAHFIFKMSIYCMVIYGKMRLGL